MDSRPVRLTMFDGLRVGLAGVVEGIPSHDVYSA